MTRQWAPSAFRTDGHLVGWDDLRVPVTAINPPGLESDPDIDTTYGFALFSGSGTEVLFTAIQLPHSWAEGTVLRPHFHWMKTTSASGTVLWQLDYRWAGIGDIMDGDWTTLSSSTPTVSDDNTAYKHALTALGDLDATGQTLSAMLICKLSRIGGSDTYAADAALLEFDIHYQVDSPGSQTEYVK